MFTALTSVLFLGMLIKANLKWEKPYFFAGLYGLVGGALRLDFGMSGAKMLAVMAATMIASIIYFGVLDLLEEGSGWWWFVLVAGFVAACF